MILGVKSKNEVKSTPKGKWPKELIDYQSKYHCLANFWVIPMCHGRSITTHRRYDSLDYYLNEVDSQLIKNPDGYFQNFTTYETFLEIHGMSGYETSDNPLEIYKSKDKKGCFDEIQLINCFWKKRASEIAKNILVNFMITLMVLD